MPQIFALVDCNNFYASCEKIFYPSLEGKPVVVLSNNDGCVIARSEEAKRLGIKMAVPVFEIADIIHNENVHVFSTNYALYGDISQRVTNILAGAVPEMEIYSIDEAFLDISAINEMDQVEFATKLKQKVKQWTGIPVSIGIGPSKTLAKLANHIAKDMGDSGVFSFINHPEKDNHLKNYPVGKIWGVGEKYEAYFLRTGIKSAFDLQNVDENRVREKLGIMGQRLVKELQGTVCYPLNQNPETKKEICTSRSFGRPLTSYHDLEQATTTYVGKVVQKLRKQNSLAQSILIFIMTNKFTVGPQYVNYKIVKLPSPTNQTQTLIHYALIALKALYREGYQYKKTGAIVSDVIPETSRQASLWDDSNREKNEKLLETIDRINKKAGLGKVKFAIQGSEENWKMRQLNLSPHYTTDWNDLLIIDTD